ncbi:MAG: O-antigen ligase family protein [Minisyncoccia bacterium]
MNNSQNKKILPTAEPMLAKILRYFVYLSAFMPLIIFNDFISPFHFGKVVIFRSAVEIMVLLYIVLIIKDRSYLPPRTKLFWAITGFTAAYGLTTFTSVSFFQSFWGTLERMGGFFSMLHFWAFFIILSAIFRKKKEWINLVNLFLIASLGSAFYGFLQKTSWTWIIGSGSRVKIFGTIGNSALFAGYMIVCGFLALTLSRVTISPAWRKFYYLVFVLNSIAVFLAGVRGSVIALVAGIIIFGLWLSVELGLKKVKNYSLAFLGLIILGTGILLAARNTSFVRNNSYLDRYSDLSINSTTVQTRFWAWTAGFEGFVDSARSVIVGYGPENFDIPFSIHFNPKFYNGPGSETLFDRAHNQFLEVLFTMGIVGFMTYILIFFFAFKATGKFKSGDPKEQKGLNILKIGLITTLIAYMIHNSFIFDTSANYLVFFLILGLINFFSLPPIQTVPVQHDNRKQLIKQNGSSTLAYIVGIILIVPTWVLIYDTNILPAIANYTTTRAIVLGWSGQFSDAIVQYEAALKYDVLGKYEIRNRFAQDLLQDVSGKKLDDTFTQAFLVAADYEKKNIQQFPDDYLPYLYLSRIYITLGSGTPTSPYNDMALDNSLAALKIAPKFVRTYFEVAQGYLNKGDEKDAIVYFQQAADLNPTVGLSWWYLGITQIDSGDTTNGLKNIGLAYQRGYDYKSDESNLVHLVTVYLKLKDYQNLDDIYMNLVKVAPNNPQYHASYAVVLAQLGQIDAAVEQAHIAAQLDATFQPEAQKFVQSLGRQW